MGRRLLGEKNGGETGRTFVTAPSVAREVGGPDGIRICHSDSNRHSISIVKWLIYMTYSSYVANRYLTGFLLNTASGYYLDTHLSLPI